MPDVTRRRLLGLGLGLAAGAGAGAALSGLGLPTATRVGPATRAAPVTRGRSDPVSMAMHVHASFSEGAGSMHAQLEQARRLGIDVVWWTEHDFRLRAHGYRRAVRFDGRSEPEDGVDWTWRDSTSGPMTGAAGRFVTDEHSPDEAGAALRLAVTGPEQAWGALTWAGQAWNSTYTTAIADTTLDLDVLAEALGPDAELVVAARLSFHPASAGRPAGQYALQYRFGSGGPRATEADGLLGVVPRALGAGWQRVHLDLRADAAALWPDLVAGDDALTELSVGVRARRGATAQAVVDRLRFTRSARDDALALQAELMGRYAERYPAVSQLQASELSLVRHLNVFGGEQILPDYPQAGPRKDDSVTAATAMVAWARRHGRLVSYNHPLDGTGSAAVLARVLVETRNLGAHALEVGTPQDVEAIATAYDVAARNSIFVTATGVSDDHSGQAWETRRARWVTSVRADSLQEADLLAAVSAGRAWFWDLAGWSGTLDLRVAGEPAMGGVLVTPASSTAVEVVATDLPADATLEIVVGRVDNAGAAALQPAVEVTRLPARSAAASVISAPADSYVRAVVRDRDGATVGFSNPVWLLREQPPGGVPADRLL